MRFYIKCKTEKDDIVLTVKGKTKQDALDKLYKNYNVLSVISISDEPIQDPILYKIPRTYGSRKFSDLKATK